MNFLQSVLYKVQPPIAFTVELSEPETRITLKELCGSVWDDCDFDGEVSQNSFSFVKRNHSNTRGIPRVALDGDFHGENGRTRVTISPRIRACDIIGVLMSFLFGGIFLVLGVSGIPFALMAMDMDMLLTSFFVAAFAAGSWAFEYCMISVSFRKSVEIIKATLVSSERHHNHTDISDIQGR